MNTRVTHKHSSVTPGVAFCGAQVSPRYMVPRWRQVSCMDCRRQVLDELQRMPCGEAKDELVDELLGSGKGKGVRP